jgi:hypothetical protein
MYISLDKSDYKSTTNIAKEYGLIPSKFISFLEDCKLIYRDDKSLRLSSEAIKLGGTYNISENGKWIIWPKNALVEFIYKFNNFRIDILNNYSVNYFYHMTHINNIQSILKYGLLPNGNNYQINDISDLDVNNRRFKLEPIYNKSIHKYVPLYFNPKNAMLYVRKNIQQDIVILVLKKDLILKNKVVFTDGNASCAITKFFNKIEDLSQLDWECLKDNTWNDHIDGKRKRMAEILVPDYVSIDNIEYIICNNTNVKIKIEDILKQMNLNIKIYKDINKKIYF